ncbi:MAG TPA: TVP38/TMEM64 family protein [Gammaproteobacteria bacterium]|nr:TVP38/TMEM64 family protein [Gammaproteobacteria bacterium]
MLPLNRRTLLLVLLLTGFFAGLALLLYSTGLLDLFLDRQRLLTFIDEHRRYAVLLFITLQALQVVAAPLPGEVTGFVGGLLFGPVWGVLFSTIGLTIGSWAAFMLARTLGRPLVERLVDRDTMRRYDYVMRHKGLVLAFLLFLIPGFPKDYLCYLLGLGHMRQRDFLLVSIPGRILGTTLLTLGGSYFRDARWGAFFLIVGLALAALLVVMIYRKQLERLARRLQAWQRLKGMLEKRRRKPD